MAKFVTTLFIIVIHYAFAAEAMAGSKKYILKRVDVDLAQARDRVVGMETYRGEIVSSRRIDRASSEIRAYVPSADDVLSTDEIVLKDGRTLEPQELTFLWVARKVKKYETEGAHPNNDDGTAPPPPKKDGSAPDGENN